MGFTFIITVLFLAVGSPFLGQVTSMELLRSSPTEHHRAKRQQRPQFSFQQRPPFRESQSQVSSFGRVCPLYFEKHDGICYYFSSVLPDGDAAKMLNWQDAKTACENHTTFGEGDPYLAHLVNDLNSFTTNNWLIQRIIQEGKPVWLGAQWKNNVWDWLKSDVDLNLNDPFWGPDQPNDKGGPQHCLSTVLVGIRRVPKRQYFNDENCNEKLHYVCQFVL